MNKQVLAASSGVKRRGNGADPMGANSEIGRKLKQYYEEIVSEEIPDRFSLLLSQLEKAEASQKKG
jgi:hypothetical protein